MPQKKLFHKKINKKVKKQNIRNSENWLFDDVSEITILISSSFQAQDSFLDDVSEISFLEYFYFGDLEI